MCMFKIVNNVDLQQYCCLSTYKMFRKLFIENQKTKAK